MLKQLFVFLFISILVISCGEKKNGPEKILSDKEKYTFDSTDLKTQGIDKSGKSFLMEYKFKNGDKFVYRLTTISIDTTISSRVNQKVVYLLDLNVKEVDADGVAEVEMKINSLKLDASANGQIFSFEAGKDNDTAKTKQFAEFYALYNNPFSVRFNKKGEVLEVYKTDKIANKFLEKRGALDTISTEDKNLIKQDLVNGVLNPLVTQIIRKLPEKDVYKDSTWQIQQKPISLMIYQINYVNLYKLESVELLNNDRIAVVDANIKFTYSGQSKVNQGNVAYNFQKPVSTAEGKIYFNVDKGIQVKSRTKTRLEISYTMEANTPKGKQKGKRADVVANTNILELL